MTNNNLKKACHKIYRYCNVTVNNKTEKDKEKRSERKGDSLK